jgi:hypothetical protein
MHGFLIETDNMVRSVAEITGSSTYSTKAFHVFCVPVMKDLWHRGHFGRNFVIVISSCESHVSSITQACHHAIVAMPFHGDAFVLVLS